MADCVDAFIVVVEPGQRSIQTLKTIKKLAQDIGVKKNCSSRKQSQNRRRKTFIMKACGNIPGIGFFIHDPELIEADRLGQTPFDKCIHYTNEVKSIKDNIFKLINN